MTVTMGGGDHEFLAPSLPSEPQSQRMTNEDFRKLMMTPRAGQTPAPGSGSQTPGGQTPSSQGKKKKDAKNYRYDKEKAEERRRKKIYYAKLRKDEDDKMAELAAKYRDRAKERRDGGEPGAPGQQPNPEQVDATTTAYRAVAPNARETHDAAERRRQMIQESKYLGGDMEHTHLVKGLDFALLQKVRAEIFNKEQQEEQERELEQVEEENEKEKKEKEKVEEEKVEDDEEIKEDEDDVSACRTVVGKNIVRTVFKPEIPKQNELFFPGRMAYVMDLEDESESDIPTTTIRSKKDVVNSDQKATLSTNDIVINKLTQILTYLRAGTRSKKKKRDKLFDDEELKEEPTTVGKKTGPAADLPIYEDVGDYRPRKEEKKERGRDERRDRDRGREDERRRDDRRDDRRDHRDRDRDRDRFRDRDDRDMRQQRTEFGRPGDRRHPYGEPEQQPYQHPQHPQAERKSYFDAPAEQEPAKKGGFSEEDRAMIKALMKKEEEAAKQKEEKRLNGLMEAANEMEYAECYPGLAEMYDATGDSDDEADYSKMDMGNKKGPVGRWDFDTTEEYADYMNKKEALPKAAYQYGVKMSDGRKTKGKIMHNTKNEKAKLDREWNQISALIDKRKAGGSEGGGKKAKYD